MIIERNAAVTVINHAIPITPSPVHAGTKNASGMRSSENVVKIAEIARVCPEPMMASAVTISIPTNGRHRLSTRRYSLPIRCTSGSREKKFRNTPGTAKNAINLLEGICPEAVELFKDRQFSVELGRVIRKMKPTRQVECAELMVAANNMTVAYAEALLVATASTALVDGVRPRKIVGVGPEQMARMEREMSNLQGQYRLVEQSYGQDVLNLVLARGYLAKLLENAKVTKYVKQRQPEVLEQFTAIVATTSLDQ